MDWNTCQKQLPRLTAAGFDCEVEQFSPDRDGWGVRADEYLVRTVGEADKLIAIIPQAVREFVERANRD